MDYTVKEVLKDVYQIQEPEGFSATVVLGGRKALLFDTMTGRGDLKSLIREITGLPLVVVNSHGHYDHIGGNIQFGHCYLHRDDWDLPAQTAKKYPAMPTDLKKSCEQVLRWMSRKDALLPVCPGQTICLGDINFQVVSLKGHTSGSIGLYCNSLKLLLSGDAFTPQTCLFFPESLPLETYLETVDRASRLDFTSFITGHQCRAFPREVLGRFRDCAVLAGKQGKSMLYAYPFNPATKGQIYILDTCDPTIQEMICLIARCTGERQKK